VFLNGWYGFLDFSKSIDDDLTLYFSIVLHLLSKHRLLNEWKIPKGVLSCLPYISIGSYEIYWISDVIQVEFRFRTIPPATRTLWATKQQERVRHYLQDVEEFELAYKYN